MRRIKAHISLMIALVAAVCAFSARPSFATVCMVCIDPAPLTQGFWGRVCTKPHPDQPDRSILSPVLCEDLKPNPTSSPCEQARSQRAAVILNILSDRIQIGCSATGTGKTVGDVVTLIDSLIAQSTTTACKRAQALAAAINEGGVQQ